MRDVQRVLVALLQLIAALTITLAVAPASSAAGAMPAWQLPFENGQRWQAGSPHGTNRSALDFGPTSGNTNRRVVTIAPGTVYKVTCSSGSYLGVDHGDGWVSTYYHLVNPQVQLIGQVVPAGTYLGDAGQAVPCGGSATFNHVHVVILKDGVATPVNGFRFGNYRVYQGSSNYYGYWNDAATGARVVTNNGAAACCLTSTTPAPTPVPTTPPPAVTAKGLALFRLTSDMTFSWSATDNSGSGLRSYDVRYRSAYVDGGFGDYVLPSNWQAITRTSVSKTDLVEGRTYCFSVRARDNAGGLSAWSAERCTTRALDDRALTRGTGWSAKTDAAYYDGTYFSTSTVDSTLARANVQVARVAVVVTKCGSCGDLGVYVGSTLVGTINMYADVTARQQVVTLAKFPLTTGTVTVKVLSSGKTVQVDGIALTRV